jgi:hypothetical protein
MPAQIQDRTKHFHPNGPIQAFQLGLERQPRPLLGAELDPHRAEHAQHLAVGADQRVAVCRSQLLQQRCEPRAHVHGRLPSGRAVGPYRPARDGMADVLGQTPLVVAVVELEQLVTALRAVAQARQLARLGRAPQRAHEHALEPAAGEPLAQRSRRAAAGVGERHVGASRVLERATPFRLAVADEHDLRSSHRASIAARAPVRLATFWHGACPRA